MQKIAELKKRGKYTWDSLKSYIDKKTANKDQEDYLSPPKNKKIYCNDAILKLYGCSTGFGSAGNILMDMVIDAMNREVWAAKVDYQLKDGVVFDWDGYIKWSYPGLDDGQWKKRKPTKKK